jgi:hypothetical protein
LYLKFTGKNGSLFAFNRWEFNPTAAKVRKQAGDIPAWLW